MKGMECYTGAFENEAYRQQIVRDLDQYRMELEVAKAAFDELDAENQREIAIQRQVDLIESKKQSSKLTNQINDAQKAEAGLEGEELVAAQAATQALRDAKTKLDGEYAIMEEAGAQYQVDSLTKNIDDLDQYILNLRGNVSYAQENAAYFREELKKDSTPEDEKKFIEEEAKTYEQ